MLIQAQDINEGKRLHGDHCVQCHTPDIYTRENRIVNNFIELEERVQQCELANQLTWFDEDIDAVINYLNTTYYQFRIE